MTDKLSREQRSRVMSRIRSKNTKLEMILRKKLWSRGLRYRTYSSLIGKPDLILKNKKLVIFIDSCFWHNCPTHARKPNSNQAYWNKKLERNARRDIQVTIKLKSDGWKVMRFWEHDLTDIDKCVAKVLKEF